MSRILVHLSNGKISVSRNTSNASTKATLAKWNKTFSLHDTCHPNIIIVIFVWERIDNSIMLFLHVLTPKETYNYQVVI